MVDWLQSQEEIGAARAETCGSRRQNGILPPTFSLFSGFSLIWWGNWKKFSPVFGLTSTQKRAIFSSTDGVMC